MKMKRITTGLGKKPGNFPKQVKVGAVSKGIKKPASGKKTKGY
jgi:hypothetical protein